jgi:hypothetical protein
MYSLNLSKTITKWLESQRWENYTKWHKLNYNDDIGKLLRKAPRANNKDYSDFLDNWDKLVVKQGHGQLDHIAIVCITDYGRPESK